MVWMQGHLQKKISFSWRHGEQLIVHTMTKLSMGKVGFVIEKMHFEMNQ